MESIKNSLKRRQRYLYRYLYKIINVVAGPKKICLLSEHYARKQGTRDKLQLNYFTASKELYDIPYFTPRLLEIYNERNIPINLNVRVKGVDTSAKQVHFEKIETKGEEKIVTPFVEDYDFLHFTPAYVRSRFRS